MIDTFLRIAYRFAPEPIAERISLLISERRCLRRWNDAVARHVEGGGVVATYRSNAGEQSFLLGGER